MPLFSAILKSAYPTHTKDPAIRMKMAGSVCYKCMLHLISGLFLEIVNDFKRWRRERDLNPRYRFMPVYSLSRRAPSADSDISPDHIAGMAPLFG